MNSKLLTAEQRQKISERLDRYINADGILKITAEASRSQIENKRIALKKFFTLITDCFREKKKRIKTKISRQSKEKRIKEKKIRSERKISRSRPGWE